MFKFVVAGAFIIGVILFTVVKYARVGWREGIKAISQGLGEAYDKVFGDKDS